MTYFGTEQQIALQRRSEELYEWICSTKGCCNAGRFCGVDDPESLGWDAIAEIVRRDGVVGFRLISSDQVSRVSNELAALGARWDAWEVFVASAEASKNAARSILATGTPSGLTEDELSASSSHDELRGIQTFISEAGIAPFSGSMLNGQQGPARTKILRSSGGDVVACAHVYLPHNRYSHYHTWAWGGLVAVAPSQRRRGLGKWINARAVLAAVDELHAESIYELVASDNTPSRLMVESCGFQREPLLTCGMGTKDRGKFTR